jgi:hypothetical protein
MKPEKVNEIMGRIIKVWIKRHGLQNLDHRKIEAVRNVLLLSPHDDGFIPVQIMENGETYLVPIEDIILNGLKGEDVKKYKQLK